MKRSMDVFRDWYDNKHEYAGGWNKKSPGGKVFDEERTKTGIDAFMEH